MARNASRDVMSPEKRSALMSRIKGKDTGPERVLAELLRGTRFKFERHSADLPGRPDFVHRARKVAVFVDGDFWHGWRFPAWQHKLAPFWRGKIAGNRARDLRNFWRLRQRGWSVVRVWEHQLESCPKMVLERVISKLRKGRSR